MIYSIPLNMKPVFSHFFASRISGLILTCAFAVVSHVSFAQNVGINDNGAAPNSAAILDIDVSTNNKGVLIPRLTTAQRVAIGGLGAGEQGLTVYDETTDTFWYWDGTQWVEIQTSGLEWKLNGNSGTNPTTNFLGTTDAQDLVIRTSNTERMRVKSGGNVGIGTNNPQALLQVENGAIMPDDGNASNRGIYFPANPGGGSGDEAYIRYYVEAGENTKLVIANQNDVDDDIDLQTGGQSRINIDGDGSILIDEGVLFDCNDCGATNTIDGTSDWGDLIIQGRVFSTNSNLHLSPPGGFRVVINSTYRAAGGATGTTGLDIEDGGIRMRKNYYYFQRYRYCNCYGAGSGTYDIGNYDFCAIAHFGFKNNQSSTDEDDDVQCAVYPVGYGGSGEQTNYNTSFTYQFNSRPLWRMYLEAYEDSNGVTCGANCINFD